MRYKVNGEIFDDPEDAVECCISEDYHKNDDYFEEWVNDNWGSIEIAGYTYYAYDILDKAGDLYSFLDDFCESMNEADRDDAIYELTHSDEGDEVYCQGDIIECIKDEYDDDEYDDEDYEVKFAQPNALERLRIAIEQAQAECESAAAEEKRADDDMLKMFQVIK